MPLWAQLREQHDTLVRAVADLENRRTARTVDSGRAEHVLTNIRQRREDTILRWLSDEPEVEPVPQAADQPLEELQSRVTVLRNRLRRIGPVNPLAVEEFTELEERAHVPARTDRRSGSCLDRTLTRSNGSSAAPSARTSTPRSSKWRRTFAPW